MIQNSKNFQLIFKIRKRFNIKIKRSKTFKLINDLYKSNKNDFSSCNHAIFILKVAARIAMLRAKTRDQRLYVCAVDASEAYDKVSRNKLWIKLIEKKLPPEIIAT